MPNKKINDLRDKLNNLITNGADFSEIQRVSQLLDDCLVEYYNEKLKKEWYFAALCG